MWLETGGLGEGNVSRKSAHGRGRGVCGIARQDRVSVVMNFVPLKYIVLCY